VSCDRGILWPSGAPTGAVCGLEEQHTDVCVDTYGQTNVYAAACQELVRLFQQLDAETASPARAHGYKAQSYQSGGGEHTFAARESEQLHEILTGHRHLYLIREIKRFHGTLVRVPWSSQQLLAKAFAVRGVGHGSEGDAKTVAIGGPSERKEAPAVVRQDIADVGVRRILTFGREPEVCLYDLAFWIEPELHDMRERVRKTAATKTTQKAVEAYRGALTKAKWRAWQRLLPALADYDGVRAERVPAEKLARESEKAQRASQLDARIARMQEGQPARGKRVRAPEHKVFSDEEAERIRRWVSDTQGDGSE